MNAAAPLSRLAALLAVAVLPVACSGGSDRSRFAFGFPLDQPALTRLAAVPAFSNLQFVRPVFVTHAGDGTDRIFVVEQGGRILVFPNDPAAFPAQVFLDIRSRVTASSGEQGLLGGQQVQRRVHRSWMRPTQA